MKFLAFVLSLFTFAASCMTPKRGTIPRCYEDEFLYWCMPENGEDGRWPVYGGYPNDCSVERISRGQFDHWPITVNADYALTEPTLEAIEAVNQAVGFQLLKFETTNLDTDVIVIKGHNPFLASLGAIAEAQHSTQGGRHYGTVKFYNELYLGRSDIVLHELGHILGLKHDPENRNSIMFPTTATRVATLERWDIQALRQIYLD